MKVLHIFNEINFSGAELMYLKASILFQKKGCELHAVSTGKEEGLIADLFRKAGFTVHHFPIPDTLNKLQYFLTFNKFLRENGFDVMHIHRSTYYSYFSFLAKTQGLVCIRTIHSVFKHRWFTKWIGIANRVISRKILGVKFQSVSPSVKDNEGRYYYNLSKLVYNWYDQESFFPSLSHEEKINVRRSLGLEFNDFVVITVGRCVEEKRHNDIIKAIECISDYSSIKFLHLGDGSHLPCEKQFAKQHNVEDRVLFVGNKTNVRDYLIAADVFVMTSRFEGLGNAAIEAMGCGFSLVVYNVSGLRDLVMDGVNGYLCPQQPNELAKRLLWLYNNPDLRHNMAKKSYDFALSNFTMENGVQSIYDLYTS